MGWLQDSAMPCRCVLSGSTSLSLSLCCVLCFYCPISQWQGEVCRLIGQRSVVFAAPQVTSQNGVGKSEPSDWSEVIEFARGTHQIRWIIRGLGTTVARNGRATLYSAARQVKHGCLMVPGRVGVRHELLSESGVLLIKNLHVCIDWVRMCISAITASSSHHQRSGRRQLGHVMESINR